MYRRPLCYPLLVQKPDVRPQNLPCLVRFSCTTGGDKVIPSRHDRITIMRTSNMLDIRKPTRRQVDRLHGSKVAKRHTQRTEAQESVTGRNVSSDVQESWCSKILKNF
jgi:hypothetical protein